MLKKSLIVNDDTTSLFIISKMLNKAHFTDEVITANNGENALAYFSEIVSLGEGNFDKAPEFIFLDLYMPIMNGWDFLAIFSAKYASLFPETKVVIVSSTAAREDILKLGKYGIVSDFICVPVTLDKLNDLKKRHYPKQKEADSVVKN